MGRLQGRDDALKARDFAERCERVAVCDRLVARAAAVAQEGVLGAGARVIEAGRDRVGLNDLALLVLHDRREGAVEHTGATAHGEGGAVARGTVAGVKALAAGLHADQLHLGIT